MFDFNWKYKDYEIRTTHQHEGQPYVELLKTRKTESGRAHSYVLAYFHYNSSGTAELHFVGDRPFKDIAELDIQTIWKQLWLAADMMNDALSKDRNEEDGYY